MIYHISYIIYHILYHISYTIASFLSLRHNLEGPLDSPGTSLGRPASQKSATPEGPGATMGSQGVLMADFGSLLESSWESPGLRMCKNW